MTLVIDASVVLRSLIACPGDALASERAAAALSRVVEGEHGVLQPPHWLAEVAEALQSMSPQTASQDVTLLAALEWPECREPLVFSRACELAALLRRPVRETLYHATALEAEDGLLVTADLSYLRAARHVSRVVSVAEWLASGRPAAGPSGGGGGPRSTSPKASRSGG